MFRYLTNQTEKGMELMKKNLISFVTIITIILFSSGFYFADLFETNVDNTYTYNTTEYTDLTLGTESADIKPTYLKALDYAKSFVGVPYVYGGNSPSGFDCSGYVMYVMSEFGINLPRTSYEQMQSGLEINFEDAIPGDLLFFRNGGHVGIYVGNGQYIHAPQSGRTVSIDPITRDDICSVKRIF